MRLTCGRVFSNNIIANLLFAECVSERILIRSMFDEVMAQACWLSFSGPLCRRLARFTNITVVFNRHK